MVILAGRFFGCAIIAASALLYAEGRDWLCDTHSRGVAHSTAIGEVQHLLLEDGSRVDLNTDSELRTQVQGDRRVAMLARGEARFRVDGNGRVAFVVVAGTAHVKSSNADFSVRRVNNSQVDVLVKSGRVDISVPNPEAALPGFQLSPLLALTAASGEAISLRANSVYVRESLASVILERRTAWTDGWLWFTAAPLPQAVAEFNRYHRQQLVLVDPRLASLQIGGRFRSSDLDSFIATLEHSFDIRTFDLRTASTEQPGADAATIYLTERCSRALQQCN